MANFVGTNYTMIFTLMAVFLIIIAIVGGVLMPELGEKGKLAQQPVRSTNKRKHGKPNVSNHWQPLPGSNT